MNLGGWPIVPARHGFEAALATASGTEPDYSLHLIASKPMAVRPLIRPRPRVTAPAATPAIDSELLAGLPRVLSRVSECAGQESARSAPRQPTVKPVSVASSTASQGKTPTEEKLVAAKPEATKPTLPAFWQSRKVLVAAGIMALVSAVAVGYQFRPKQQIIVVHPAKQPAAVATSPAASNSTTKPTFQPLNPAATTPAKETTSTASLIPRATWPPEKTPDPTPSKSPTPPTQTATKPIDTRTSLNQTPNYAPAQDNLPRMSPQFPQAPNPTSNSASNSSIVYNPTMNAGPSPLASTYIPQNNQPPQSGTSPQYTAARPNFPQNMQPGQPLPPPQDGSFGAYGGARFEGQIQPLPLRR